MGERRRSTADRAAAALVIRRAAEPLLLHGILNGDAWVRAAQVNDEGWRLFLRVERCALPLSRAVERAPDLARLHYPFRDVLTAAAHREALRVLVVRAHLQTAAELAATLGVLIIVLKGGVLAMGDDPIEMSDVDVLVPEEEAANLAAALEARGWQLLTQNNARVSHVLAARGMDLEIHRSLGFDGGANNAVSLDCSELLETAPPLRQLGSRDHLHHVVQHVALSHPNRRLRLRDLILIAHAARRCQADELASAFAEAGAYTARVSRAMLDAALKQTDGDAKRERERRVLQYYVLALRTPLPFVPRDVNQMVDAWSVAMLSTKWERRQLWENVRARFSEPSFRPRMRAIDLSLSRRSAALGWLWRVASRCGHYGSAWAVGRIVAARVRRTAGRALISPSLLNP